MDFDWAAALPIGILFFIGTIIGATRRRAGKALAQRKYPALAEKLGLDFEEPRYAGWVGKLRGRIDGFDVLVEPDERARMVVFLDEHPQVQLRTYEHFKRVPEGWVSFSLGSRRLDAWVVNRLCPLGAQDTFAESRQLQEAVVALKSWERLKQLTVEPQRIEASMDYGTPPFIPATDVELILPQLLALARAVIETAATAKGASAGQPAAAEQGTAARPESTHAPEPTDAAG